MSVTSDRRTVRQSVADALGLRGTAKITVVTDTKTVTVPGLRNFYPDETPVLDAGFCEVVNKESTLGWRKCDTYDQATDVLVVETAFDGSGPAVNDILEIYQHLTPDEINLAINDSLGDLYYEDRVTVTLVAGQNLYSLSSSAAWFQRKGQVLKVLLRYTPASNRIEEVPAGGFTIIEEDDAVSIYLHQLPPDVANTALIVSGRHHYDALASDTATTTCPLPLFKAEVTFRVLKAIWGKMGSETAKALYGAEMVEAERRRVMTRATWLPQVQTRDITLPEPYAGPEFAVDPIGWEW